MPTQLDQFVGDLRQALAQQQNGRIMAMAEGKCEDMAHYKKLVGEVNGLKEAADVAVALLKRSDIDDLDSRLGGIDGTPAGDQEDPPKPPANRRSRNKS